MRTLVLYYSRTGHTRDVARDVAAALGADLEAIVDPTRRSGLLGWLRCGYEAGRRRAAPIWPLVHEIDDYDLVVVGTPIWNGTVSSPARAALARLRGRLPAVAFFSTMSGDDAGRLFRDMESACGAAPTATLAVSERSLARPGAAASIVDFAARARAGLASRSTSREPPRVDARVPRGSAPLAPGSV
jgi:flavodoxin